MKRFELVVGKHKNVQIHLRGECVRRDRVQVVVADVKYLKDKVNHQICEVLRGTFSHTPNYLQRCQVLEEFNFDL